MNLLEAIKRGEGKTLEFKEKIPVNESIAKTVVSFSNTSGGKLLIGVNDKREITGIEDMDIFELQEKLTSIIHNSCYPDIIPEIYTTNIEDKLILVVEVFRGSLLPYYLKSEGKNNGTYIRIGNTNRKAGFENILELERQKRNVSFDEEADYEVKLENLDLNPLEEEFKKIGKSLDKDKLLNMKLIKNENGNLYPSKGLLILLGYYENVMIKCARFKGKTMDIFIDKKEYAGDVFSQLENTEKFILNHINIRGEIKGLQRTDTFEIPPEALRESLINAFVHRDYSNMGRDIKLGIYDDIVNIVSPGGFPNNLLEEDILFGRSEIRNKVVAKVFKELGYIEQWGSGIKRIKSSCFNAGLKEPIVRETNDFVDVEFYRANNIDGSDKVAISSDKVAINNEDKILEYIKTNKKITNLEAREITGLSSAGVRRIFVNLVKKSIIEPIGEEKSRYYVVRG